MDSAEKLPNWIGISDNSQLRSTLDGIHLAFVVNVLSRAVTIYINGSGLDETQM